jgi:hypothetical protein
MEATQMNNVKSNLRSRCGIGIVGVLAVVGGGCSTSASAPPASPVTVSGKQLTPPPDVHECALISSGSPSKYVCNGKTYTTFDLVKLRNQYAAQLQQAGK